MFQNQVQEFSWRNGPFFYIFGIPVIWQIFANSENIYWFNFSINSRGKNINGPVSCKCSKIVRKVLKKYWKFQIKILKITKRIRKFSKDLENVKKKLGSFKKKCRKFSRVSKFSKNLLGFSKIKYEKFQKCQKKFWNFQQTVFENYDRFFLISRFLKTLDIFFLKIASFFNIFEIFGNFPNSSIIQWLEKFQESDFCRYKFFLKKLGKFVYPNIKYRAGLLHHFPERQDLWVVPKILPVVIKKLVLPVKPCKLPGRN